jgi:hypothetical protein
MNPKSKELLESAMYHLKEKLPKADTPQMVEKITDCLIDIATYIERGGKQ